MRLIPQDSLPQQQTINNMMDDDCDSICSSFVVDRQHTKVATDIQDPHPTIIQKLDSCSTDSLSTASLTEDEQAPEERRSVRFALHCNQEFSPTESEETDYTTVWYSRQEFATFKKDTIATAKALAAHRQIMDFSNTMSFGSLLETLHDNCVFGSADDEPLTASERKELIAQYDKELTLEVNEVKTRSTMLGLERLVLTGIQSEKLQRRADLNKLVQEIQAYAKNVGTPKNQRAKVLGREVRKATEPSRLFAQRLALVQRESFSG